MQETKTKFIIIIHNIKMNDNLVGYEEVKRDIPESEKFPTKINDLVQHIHNYNTDKPIKINTLKKYITDIHIIRKIYNPNLPENNFDFLSDFKTILDIIRNKYTNINSISTIINSISSVLMRIHKYRHLYDNIYKEINDMISKEKKRQILDSENKLTLKESNKYVDWNTILQIEPNINDNEDLMIFHLYTTLPPRRISDYSNIKIINNENDDNNKDNFILIKRERVQKIILNNYKTSKTYGKFINSNIPKKLNDSILAMNPKNGNFLLNYNNTYFSRKITNIFRKYLGIPITVNILRHSYITHMMKKNISTKKKKEIAILMGHNIQMQDEYRRITLERDD